MDKDQIIDFIRSVPLFRAVSPEQLAELASAAEVRDVGADVVVVERNTEGHEIFVIVEGEFEVYLRDEAMDFERELVRFFPGDQFGDIAALTGQSRTASVRAVTAGRVIVLHRDSIESLLDSSREFRRAIFQAMGEYLKRSSTSFSAFSFGRLDSFDNMRSTVSMLPPRVCRFCEALPVERKNNHVTVAMVNPSDVNARSFIVEALKEYHVRFVAVSDEDFEHHAAMLLGAETVSQAAKALEDLAYINSSGERIAIAAVGENDCFPRILSAAVRSGASDIHIEPGEKSSRVRLRIDGKMLVFEDGIPTVEVRQLVSRIKVMSDLDITNIRRPQDGRLVIESSDDRTEFRISSTPCQGGEKVVMRVQGRSQQLMKLSNLILSEPVARFAQDIFENPSGLLLVAGPTGSGKTTTLYAALHGIDEREHAINMVTIEDPIELNLPFATQIQVDHNLDLNFANILRTVLRQDPDVILVGEIRDSESAEIAFEAATTGHLVLSSLHSYSALESVVRLRDLGVEPYVIANALKGVISQKLVPRLSPGYTEPVPADDPAVATLRRFGILDDNFDGELLRGVDTEGGPPGGESGRIGVFEMLSVGDELRDAIDRNASSSELRECLDPRWFISFARYSRFLLTHGLVAPEQIVRIFPRHEVIGRESS